MVWSEESQCMDIVQDIMELAWLKAETRGMALSPSIEGYLWSSTVNRDAEEDDKVDDKEISVVERKQMFNSKEDTFNNILDTGRHKGIWR